MFQYLHIELEYSRSPNQEKLKHNEETEDVNKETEDVNEETENKTENTNITNIYIADRVVNRSNYGKTKDSEKKKEKA